MIEDRSEPVGPTSKAALGLERNVVGLRSSVILGMAGSAPAAVIAITLVPLITASAYGIVPSLAVSAAAMLCIALAFKQLNLWEQNAGGPYAWVSRATHPVAGFAVGWLLFAAFVVASIANVTTLGPAVLGLLGINTSSQLGAAIAACVLGGALVSTAVLGMRLTARLQIALAIAEYVILLGFAGIALFSRPAGSIGLSTHLLKPTGTGAGSLTAAVLVAIFFFAEWDAGIYETEETKRPERNPGLAVLIAVSILTVIYMVTAVAFSGVAHQPALVSHASNVAVFAARRVAGDTASRVMAFAVVSSVLAATQVTFVAGSRIAFSMSRDGVLARPFGRIHRRFNTPAIGTVVLGVASIVLTLIYIYSTSVANALSDLIATDSILFAVYYAATGLAAVWVNRKRLPTNLKMALLGGLLPLAGAGVLIWVAVKSITGFTTPEKWVLIGIVLLGVVMFVVARFVYRAPGLVSGRYRAQFRSASGSNPSDLTSDGDSLAPGARQGEPV